MKLSQLTRREGFTVVTTFTTGLVRGASLAWKDLRVLRIRASRDFTTFKATTSDVARVSSLLRLVARESLVAHARCLSVCSLSLSFFPLTLDSPMFYRAQIRGTKVPNSGGTRVLLRNMLHHARFTCLRAKRAASLRRTNKS